MAEKIVSFNKFPNNMEKTNPQLLNRYFACIVCGSTFPSMDLVIHHIGVHKYNTDKKDYKCKHCDKGFEFSRSLKIHMGTHCQIKTYDCSQCYKQFKIRCNLIDHFKRHNGKMPFKCKSCSKKPLRKLENKCEDTETISDGNKFNNTQTSKTDYNECSDINLFKCAQCGERFDSEHSLLVHNRIHTGEQPYECRLCGQRFRVDEDLAAHAKTHSENFHESKQYSTGPPNTSDPIKDLHCELLLKQAIQCEKCLKIFKSKYNFALHSRAHIRREIYQCKHCSKVFTNKSSLTKHLMDVHSGKTPYKCEECGEKFTRSVFLKLHTCNKLATDVKHDFNCEQCGKKCEGITENHKLPYKCKVCNEGSLVDTEKILNACSLNLHSFESTGESTYADQKVQKCEFCDAIFSDNSDLVQHVRRNHFYKMPYVCTECGKNYSSQKYFEKHREIYCIKNVNISIHQKHTEASNIIEGTSKHIEQKAHKKQKHIKDSFIGGHRKKSTRRNNHHFGYRTKFKGHCKLCDFKTKCAQKLAQHKCAKYKCQYCGERFMKSLQKASHITLKHKDKLQDKHLKCSFCHIRFAQMRNLEKHIKIYHSGCEFEHECKECGRAFPKKGYLKNHMILTHTQRCICEHCGKDFSQGSMKAHILTHSDEMPYTCTVCDKGFHSRAYMIKHKLLHSDEKPFQCEHCGKGFKTKDHLTRHLVLHSGKKPYECQECGKKCTQKSNHMRTHTGVKPYRCEKCGKTFTYSTSLTKHTC